MFGNKRFKYTYVSNPEENEKNDGLETTKRKCITPACFWSSVFTIILIGTYYIPSIGLTFYNRWLYQSIHFPIFTVLVHMFVKFILAAIIRCIISKHRNKEPIKFLTWKEYIVTMGPTGLFSGLDIALSNWGLELVTISLYTMTKTTTIVFILFFAILLKLEKMTWNLVVIVLMITIGLLLFTYKSTQFDFLGFLLLLIASVSSGVRWTCVQMLLQKSKMGMKNPVDMIFYMQPWMIISVIPVALWIEGYNVYNKFQELSTDESLLYLLKILLGAFIAFFMEFSEVTLVTYTSSLTLAIAGVFKDVVQLVLAVEWNGDQISSLNVVGLFVCLCGITCHVIHKLKTQSTKLPKRLYDLELDGHGTEEHLVNGDYRGELISASSEDEKSDTEVLFDILNRHDR